MVAQGNKARTRSQRGPRPSFVQRSGPYRAFRRNIPPCEAGFAAKAHSPCNALRRGEHIASASAGYMMPVRGNAAHIMLSLRLGRHRVHAKSPDPNGDYRMLRQRPKRAFQNS